MTCKSQAICKIMPRQGVTQCKHLLGSDYQIIHRVTMTLPAELSFALQLHGRLYVPGDTHKPTALC